MVFWKKRNEKEEPEEENVSEENAEESFGEDGADTSWLPDVIEVPLDIDGKQFMALSLYELPGLDVMAAQQAPEEQRLPALWMLAQKAFEQEALDRMGVLSFTDMQQILFTWTLLSGQAAAEAAQKKSRDLITKVMGDKAASILFGDDDGGGAADDDEGRGRPGRKFY